VAPEIDGLLASISMDKWESLPTATAVFARFEEICRHLSKEELNMPLKAYRWDHGLLVHFRYQSCVNPFLGYFKYRKGPPVNI